MNMSPPLFVSRFFLRGSLGCFDPILRPGALQPDRIQGLAWSSSSPEAQKVCPRAASPLSSNQLANAKVPIKLLLLVGASASS